MELPIAAKIAAADTAPKKIPLGLYQIGDLTLVPLPGEFTTIMGERIRNTVKEKLAEEATGQHVVLVGLANGHVSYVTTPEEYEAQHYEGAQNLYGAATGPVVEREIAKLFETNAPGTRVEAQSFRYENGECRVFQPLDAGLPAYNADDGLRDILLDLEKPDVTKRDFAPRCWIDAIPALPKVGETYGNSTEQCVRPVPYVWIEKKVSTGQCATLPGEFLVNTCDSPPTGTAKACEDGDPRYCVDEVPQDNCALDLVTVLHGSYGDRTRWCGFWMPRNGEDPDNFEICVAGVTDAAVQMVDSSQVSGDLDSGNIDAWAYVQPILNDLEERKECSNIRTRPVCEAPH
ncbi:MAG: hypothetical protein GY946_23395 [bacterium]|nr:hypothetical protein [bacterium]